jgi:hypothetical protein
MSTEGNTPCYDAVFDGGCHDGASGDGHVNVGAGGEEGAAHEGGWVLQDPFCQSRLSVCCTKA